MPADEFDQMLQIDVDSMRIFLKAKAQRTAVSISEFIETARLQGATKDQIRKLLLKDLEEGGRYFGEFRRAVQATSNGVINRLRDSAQFAEDYQVEKYRWVAVLVNTCPDCIDRHGRVQTMDEWEEEGLPRTGFTVCKENCKCVLINADSAVLEPVRRGERSKLRAIERQAQGESE